MTALKLGRKPNEGRPRVMLYANALPETNYTPPLAVDNYSKVPADSWGMDGNDQYGDCTLADVDHSVKAYQVAAGNMEVKSAVKEVLAAYSAITGFNPKDPSTDQGAVMQDVRDYWRKTGITLGGKKNNILLFAQVEHRNLTLVKYAVYRFGVVGLGINFPGSAMDQFDAGDPWTVDPNATIEGGHAIAMVGYDADYVYVVTWGKVQKMDWNFFNTYVEEAWIQLSEDFVNANTEVDNLGETFYQLGQQFAALTGKPNPVPAPVVPTPQPIPQPVPTPTPAPTPTPTPVPGNDAPFPGADSTVAAKVSATAAKGKMTETEWLNHHLKSYFKIK